jgi:hypothetical protein
MLFGGAGAPIAGYVRDVTGSYTSVWLVATVLLVLGTWVLASTPSPQEGQGKTLQAAAAPSSTSKQVR